MSSLVPLKHLAAINATSLPETTAGDFEFRYVDIGSVGRGELAAAPERTRFESAPSRARRRVREGDTLVSTVRTYLRAVLPIREGADDLIASTGFAVISPHAIDSRYFGWWAQSDVFIEDVVARSVGVSYPAINALELGELPVRVPPLAEQRAIADYLDAETARIDALIAKKKQLIHLLEERWQDHLQSSLDRYSWAPLRRFTTRVVVGIAEGATHAYADAGVPLLRSMNIRANRLEVEDLLYIEPWFAARNRSKTINAGDILTVRTGAPGVSAVVPKKFEGSQCFTQLISTPSQGRDAVLLTHGLNSRRAREYFDQLGWGSAQQNISVPILASCPVPDIPTHDNESLSASLEEQQKAKVDGVSILKRQVKLLAERRQALITAAVTGEFAVSGAA